jgi:hypothetical protein
MLWKRDCMFNILALDIDQYLFFGEITFNVDTAFLIT